MEKKPKQIVIIHNNGDVVINEKDKLPFSDLWDHYDHSCPSETLLLLNLPSMEDSSSSYKNTRQLPEDLSKYLLPILSGLRAAYFIDSHSPILTNDLIGDHIRYYDNYTRSNRCTICPNPDSYPSHKAYSHPLLDTGWFDFQSPVVDYVFNVELPLTITLREFLSYLLGSQSDGDSFQDQQHRPMHTRALNSEVTLHPAYENTAKQVTAIIAVPESTPNGSILILPPPSSISNILDIILSLPSLQSEQGDSSAVCESIDHAYDSQQIIPHSNEATQKQPSRHKIDGDKERKRSPHPSPEDNTNQKKDSVMTTDDLTERFTTENIHKLEHAKTHRFIITWYAELAERQRQVSKTGTFDLDIAKDRLGKRVSYQENCNSESVNEHISLYNHKRTFYGEYDRQRIINLGIPPKKTIEAMKKNLNFNLRVQKYEQFLYLRQHQRSFYSQSCIELKECPSLSVTKLISQLKTKYEKDFFLHKDAYRDFLAVCPSEGVFPPVPIV